MEIKEVTIKELIDTANKNWGYFKENEPSHIATTLDILTNHDYPFVETANITHYPCMMIWNPFCGTIPPRKNSKGKIVGIYTLTDREWNRLINSGYIEASKKMEENYSREKLDKVLMIAKKLYEG